MFLLSLLAGCVSKLESLVPPITAAKLNYSRQGKFSSTTIDVSNLRVEGDKVKAEKIEIHTNNPWITNASLTVEGYERTVKPGDAATAESPK